MRSIKWQTDQHLSLFPFSEAMFARHSSQSFYFAHRHIHGSFRIATLPQREVHRGWGGVGVGVGWGFVFQYSRRSNRHMVWYGSQCELGHFVSFLRSLLKNNPERKPTVIPVLCVCYHGLWHEWDFNRQCAYVGLHQTFSMSKDRPSACRPSLVVPAFGWWRQKCSSHLLCVVFWLTSPFWDSHVRLCSESRATAEGSTAAVVFLHSRAGNGQRWWAIAKNRAIATIVSRMYQHRISPLIAFIFYPLFKLKRSACMKRV